MTHRYVGGVCIRCKIAEATYRAQNAINRVLEIAAGLALAAPLPDAVPDFQSFEMGKECAADHIRAAIVNVECVRVN